MHLVRRRSALVGIQHAQSGIIVGTVTDVNNDTVPGANVDLESPGLTGPLTATSNSTGFFQFENLQPGTYQVTITAPGFATWVSPMLTLNPAQYMILTAASSTSSGH